MRAVSSSRDASPGRLRRTYCGSILASLTYLPQFSGSALISAAIDSAPDPAAKLQIERISRAGYSCAAAGSGDSAAWAKPSNRTALLIAWLMPFSRSLNVQFWIMPEDVVLVERDAPLRFEVRGDARPCRDPLVQRDRPRIFRHQPLHRAGKSIAQAGDHLEERQVRIGKRLAEKPSAFFARQHALEVAEEFRQALGGEVRGAALRFGLLVLVVEGAPDRVMRIVHFDQPVGDGELELVRPETRRLALRREAVRGASHRRMFAVCAITRFPAFRNGGANGRRPSDLPSRKRVSAGTPRCGVRATST